MLCNGPVPIMTNTLEMVKLSIWVGPDERLQRVLFNLGRKDCLAKAACFYLKHLVVQCKCNIFTEISPDIFSSWQKVSTN